MEKRAVKQYILNLFVPEKMTAILRGVFRRGEGQSLVEYVLIIALVSIILVASLNALGAAIVAVPIAAVVAVL